MKTAVTVTSCEAYSDIVNDGLTTRQMARYLDLLRWTADITDREAARALDLPASTVSARRNDILKDMPGRIEKSQQRRCSVSGRRVQTWKKRRESTL